MKLKTEYNCVCGSKEFFTKQNTKINNAFKQDFIALVVVDGLNG